MDVSLLLSKKTVQKMGSRMNENVASKPSSFAMKQMEKMGWTEGKGLGKTESGISTHISITKRDDSAGLGSEAVEARASAATENWWHDAFATNLKFMKNKHGKKSKSGSKKRKAEDEEEDEAPPSYDDLFKATGGARLGMRARADQKGKLKRTEDANTGAVEFDSKPTNVASETADATTTSSSDSEKEVEIKSNSDKKTKKEKKDKKDKKEKKEKKSKK